MERSGAGFALVTNGSGCGSGRGLFLRIRIRNHNTAERGFFLVLWLHLGSVAIFQSNLACQKCRWLFFKALCIEFLYIAVLYWFGVVKSWLIADRNPKFTGLGDHSSATFVSFWHPAAINHNLLLINYFKVAHRDRKKAKKVAFHCLMVLRWIPEVK